VLDNYDYEVIYVNDGSQDNSAQAIKEICLKDKKVKLVDFSRNFGHQAAIRAGLKRAKGDIIAVIDDDLQDPPEVLPKFFDKLKEGYEVVYGIRKRKEENIFKRAVFYIFYRLLRFVSSYKIPYDSGDFCVMDRKVVDAISRFHELNIFLRGIRSWAGFRQTGVEYERDARFAGKSQYSLRKYIRFAFDALFSFSYLPLRLSTIIGFIASGFSFIYGCHIAISRLSGHLKNVPGFTTIFVFMTFLGGLMLVSLGIIGEYIARLYDEAKGRPHYIVKEEIGFEKVNSKER